jgi:hypothetical protein
VAFTFHVASWVTEKKGGRRGWGKRCLKRRGEYRAVVVSSFWRRLHNFLFYSPKGIVSKNSVELIDRTSALSFSDEGLYEFRHQSLSTVDRIRLRERLDSKYSKSPDPRWIVLGNFFRL